MTCTGCKRKLDITRANSFWVVVRRSSAVLVHYCPCGRRHELNGRPERHRNAQLAAPAVVWVSDDDPAKVSVPANAAEPVEPGYHAVELRTIRERDRFAAKLNGVERAKMLELKAGNDAYFDQRRQATRDEMMRRLDSVNEFGRRPDKAKALALHKAVRQFLDRRRERKANRAFDPNVHFQVDAYDQSNRQPHASRETGWKEQR